MEQADEEHVMYQQRYAQTGRHPVRLTETSLPFPQSLTGSLPCEAHSSVVRDTSVLPHGAVVVWPDLPV